MRIIGCDLHACQQTLAMLDTVSGEVQNRTLMHEGNQVREFYAQLPRPVLVGIEATGSMHWFLNLMDELGIECRVGHPATIRAAEPRKQKHDRRDAELILKLLAENRFPAIWLPTKELLDLRALVLHRHQWVRIRTRIQNALQAIALANGLRRGPGLWSYDGQAKIAFLPLGVKCDLTKFPELRPVIVERLKAAGKQAEAAGVVIGIETSLSAAVEVKLLDDIGSPAIKSYFNFANAIQNGRDLTAELRTLGKDRLCQIHCTDGDEAWLQNDPKINLPKIKQTLDEMGWSGWLVIERSRDATRASDVKYNFSANAAHLKSVFQPAAH